MNKISLEYKLIQDIRQIVIESKNNANMIIKEKVVSLIRELS